MAEERSFRSLTEAYRFMETEIDRRAGNRVTNLGNGLELRVFSHDFGDGAFTNVYDLNWDPGNAQAAIHLTDRPGDGFELAQESLATSSAAFFVLADDSSGLPSQTSLNMVVKHGRILSLPVLDREAVHCSDGILSTAYVPADGRLTLNGTDLSWTGSLTGRAAQAYAYGNGNTVITRRPDPKRGSVRALDEASRLTPAIPAGDRWADVGFMATDDGGFRSGAIATEGELDIFTHDLVMRCQTQHLDRRGVNRMAITRVGPWEAPALPDFAATAGPSLDVPDFSAHPINRDPSFGDDPPFEDNRKARMALFHGLDGRTHLRLFDGRPASSVLQGATPTEARNAIAADVGYRWGCFLDGGGTAKLWVMEDGALTSYGNRHYLRYPEQDAGEFTWVPDSGRPSSSFITFQPNRSASLAPAREAGQQLGPDALKAFHAAMSGYPDGRPSSNRQSASTGERPRTIPRQSPHRDRGFGR